MNADSIFTIGATHSVCQDYTVAENSSTATPYVILSDGCSTSPDTDIGARLLIKAAEQILKTHQEEEPSQLARDASFLALKWAETIGLTPQSIDATLLTAYISGDELLVACSGDGVIVVGSAAGSVDAYSVSYPAGYPLYPAYVHQPERFDALLSTDRSQKEVNHFHSPSIDEPLLLESTFSSNSITQVFRFRTSDYKYAAVVSDGVHSFLSTDQTTLGKRVEPVQMAEVLKELVSFKSLNGAFVARRVKKFLKDSKSRQWQHADDLSIGVIHLGGAECSPRLPSPI